MVESLDWEVFRMQVWANGMEIFPKSSLEVKGNLLMGFDSLAGSFLEAFYGVVDCESVNGFGVDTGVMMGSSELVRYLGRNVLMGQYDVLQGVSLKGGYGVCLSGGQFEIPVLLEGAQSLSSLPVLEMRFFEREGFLLKPSSHPLFMKGLERVFRMNEYSVLVHPTRRDVGNLGLRQSMVEPRAEIADAVGELYHFLGIDF